MATERISYTSGPPSTEFQLTADRVGQDSDAMTTTVRIYLRAYNRGSTGSYANVDGKQTASIDGVWGGASYSKNPFLPSGYATDAERWNAGPWNVQVPHGDDGKRGPVTLRMSVKFGSVDITKTASFDDFPDIAAAPYPPYVKSVTNVTPTSAIVNHDSFSKPSPTSWQAQWQDKGGDSSALWSGAPTASASSSTAGIQLTGLDRHAHYLVRTRASNAAGTSDWGPSFAFATPAAVPSSTQPYYIDAQGTSGLHYLFHGPADNGGAGIVEMQVGWGTDPNNVQNTVASNGDTFINGLSRNTTYYVWSRARNDAGWSDWSERYQITTNADLPGPTTPKGAVATSQTQVHYTFDGGDSGGADILEWQVGYSTDASNVQYTMNPNGGDTVVGNLSPATNWYFWSRGRNNAGWGPWSQRLMARTIAGARIKVNGVFKEAIPYVNVNGTWKLARPYVKFVGLWRPTN